MKSGMALIVSSKLKSEDLINSPFGLEPEQFLVCGPDSLAFIGFQRFQMIILHDVSEDWLHKLSLGIRDTRELESLWGLVGGLDAGKVRILVSAPCRPMKAWVDLGLEPILPVEVKSELETVAEKSVNSGSGFHASGVMTADDVRQLHQNGVNFIDPGARLTAWAREVADSLGMKVRKESSSVIVLQLNVSNRAELKKMSGKIHEWGIAHPDLFFLVPVPFLPIFNEVCPSLRGRLTARIHWAEKGAFTGEMSLDMAIDQGCGGILLENVSPFNEKANVRVTLNAALKAGLKVFSTIPFDLSGEYGIMPRSEGEVPYSAPVMPLKDIRGKLKQGEQAREKGMAVLMTDRDFIGH